MRGLSNLSDRAFWDTRKGRRDPSYVSFADTFSHKGRRKPMLPDLAKPSGAQPLGGWDGHRPDSWQATARGTPQGVCTTSTLTMRHLRCSAVEPGTSLTRFRVALPSRLYCGPVL